MSVIQISKIQVRRGQALTGIGIPQLSSAEFAWAIDTQELFIGNGSITEGAPYVGNTKVLTEHDNILDLISGYRFGNDLAVVNSIERPLQKKLDEYVSVLDFGAVGDGSTDCLEAFTNAFDNLFQQLGQVNLKKTLVIPNGTYVFSGNLKIPSTASIRGETKDGAVLQIDSNNILFISEDGTEISDPFTNTNRPTNISVSNLTIHHLDGQTVLSGLANSRFENVKFISEYEIGDPIGALETQSASVSWENTLAGTSVTNVMFKDCEFESTPIAVRSNQITIDSSSPPLFDTFVNFDGCKFTFCDTAVVINGVPPSDGRYQGNKWKISNCTFEEVYNRAFVADEGRGTVIFRSNFINCGTNNNITPAISIVYFGDKFGNAVLDCFSDRHQTSAFTGDNFSLAAITDVENSSRTVLADMNYADIWLSDNAGTGRPLSVFGAYNRYTKIDYTLTLGEHSRVGQLMIAINGGREEDAISITDNFTYSSQLESSPGGLTMTRFKFIATLADNDADSGIETFLLSYYNPTVSGATGSISYSISYGS